MSQPVKKANRRTAPRAKPTYEELLTRVAQLEQQLAITERKKAEKALRESEARFRSVLEESRDVIYRVDLATSRYEYISPSAEAVVGFSPEELMAMDVETGLAMVHPDDASAMRAAVQRLEAHGEAHAEYRQRTKKGDYRWLSNRMSMVRDSAGRPRYRNGNIRDITEAKRAEEALRESETLLRSFFDSPGALRGIVEVVGDDILFVSVNAAAARLYGRSPEEVRGKRAAELAVPSEIIQLWLSRYRETQRTKEAVTFEVRRPTARGQAWFLATVCFLGTGPGGHPRFAYVIFDVTGLRRAEDALRAANDQLQEADRRKDEFLAVLSHELRNPLAPIRNSIHLLDRAPPGSDVARRARDVLHRQTDHLTRLVDDLLDLSRIAHGKIKLQPTRIDARDVVRRACDDVTTVFEQRGVELRFSQATEPIWVDADPARLAQMVGNLVSNALKFTPQGGKVGVSVEARGSECEVRVLDTGVGIEPAELDRIFEQFVQAGRTRHGAQAGLGIGLALVRELANKHGGSVRALSAGVGQGAEFVMALPLATAPADDVSKVQVEQAALHLSVLIVEDNEDAAASLADLLALNELEVRIVATGRAGIEAVRAWQPDVLICDVGLPDVNGFEVIRAVRAAGAKVFSIALTGYAQQQDREQALAAGFDAHLAKPPALAKLTELLAEAAKRKV